MQRSAVGIHDQQNIRSNRAGSAFASENLRQSVLASRQLVSLPEDDVVSAHYLRVPDVTEQPRRKRKSVGFDMAELGGEEDDDIEQEFKRFQSSGSTRHKEARVSLLGKPLNYRTHKRGNYYRLTQARIYNYLERPKNYSAVLYHLLVFLMAFLCLVFSVLATIPHYEKRITRGLFFLENVMVVWFMSEYILRVWSAGCRSRYQGLAGRKNFMMRPSCILDGVIIIASIVVLGVGSSGQVFATSALRGLRFFQILRMMRMDRRGGTWKLLGSVVWAHRQELLTTVYIGFLGLIFTSFVVFMVEKDNNAKFKTYADALWWGVITLCTVGYGDAVPITWLGKIIASLCAVLGVSFFALPAGILGSGFALKVQQQQRHKHLIRRRVPAAVLIQCLWRCYAADENSRSLATWKRHLKPCPSPLPEAVPAKSWRPQSSFVSRFSTRRKDRPQNQSLAANYRGRRINQSQRFSENVEEPQTQQGELHRSLKKENSCKDSEDDPEPMLNYLTEAHKWAIRSLRKIRFFVARRKFREALRPYDVKDVMEQYTSGHLDMLSRVKILQSRLDQILGKVGSKAKDVYESKQSLASRVVNIERQVEDIESKFDEFLDLYKMDRQVLLDIQQSQSSTDRTDIKDTEARTTCSSSTTTPILRKSLKPMQRNYSDLGVRVKKRVTYLSLGDVTNDISGLKDLTNTENQEGHIKEECQSDYTLESSESPCSFKSSQLGDSLPDTPNEFGDCTGDVYRNVLNKQAFSQLSKEREHMYANIKIPHGYPEYFQFPASDHKHSSSQHELDPIVSVSSDHKTYSNFEMSSLHYQRTHTTMYLQTPIYTSPRQPGVSIYSVNSPSPCSVSSVVSSSQSLHPPTSSLINTSVFSETPDTEVCLPAMSSEKSHIDTSEITPFSYSNTSENTPSDINNIKNIELSTFNYSCLKKSPSDVYVTNNYEFFLNDLTNSSRVSKKQAKCQPNLIDQSVIAGALHLSTPHIDPLYNDHSVSVSQTCLRRESSPSIIPCKQRKLHCDTDSTTHRPLSKADTAVDFTRVVPVLYSPRAAPMHENNLTEPSRLNYTKYPTCNRDQFSNNAILSSTSFCTENERRRHSLRVNSKKSFLFLRKNSFPLTRTRNKSGMSPKSDNGILFTVCSQNATT